jgi:hypothetical protein
MTLLGGVRRQSNGNTRVLSWPPTLVPESPKACDSQFLARNPLLHLTTNCPAAGQRLTQFIQGSPERDEASTAMWQL